MPSKLRQTSHLIKTITLALHVEALLGVVQHLCWTCLTESARAWERRSGAAGAHG